MFIILSTLPLCFLDAETWERMPAGEWAVGRKQNGGGYGRSSLQVDKCRERMAVQVVCFRRQYRAFVLLHG